VADSQDCTENQSVYDGLGRSGVMRPGPGVLGIAMSIGLMPVGQGDTECSKTMFRISSLR
jgi:hypothetical protein